MSPEHIFNYFKSVWQSTPTEHFEVSLIHSQLTCKDAYNFFWKPWLAFIWWRIVYYLVVLLWFKVPLFCFIQRVLLIPNRWVLYLKTVAFLRENYIINKDFKRYNIYAAMGTEIGFSNNGLYASLSEENYLDLGNFSDKIEFAQKLIGSRTLLWKLNGFMESNKPKLTTSLRQSLQLFYLSSTFHYSSVEHLRKMIRNVLYIRKNWISKYWKQFFSSLNT